EKVPRRATEKDCLQQYATITSGRATSTIDSRLATVAATTEDVQSDIEGLEDRVRMRMDEATSRAQEITDRSVSRMAELARGVQEGIDTLLQTRGVQDEERDESHRAVERRLMELEKLQKNTAFQVSHMPHPRASIRIEAQSPSKWTIVA
ncbi:hypothetical protein FOZ62_017180, partial [Perkinsus olseni]